MGEFTHKGKRYLKDTFIITCPNATKALWWRASECLSTCPLCRGDGVLEEVRIYKEIRTDPRRRT